ncbi:MAG: hypothetical protein LBH41_02675, partial [Rickettsiales bacterium]|nr:hypothetical protein [Rickettsiales bacterium]
MIAGIGGAEAQRGARGAGTAASARSGRRGGSAAVTAESSDQEALSVAGSRRSGRGRGGRGSNAGIAVSGRGGGRAGGELVNVPQNPFKDALLNSSITLEWGKYYKDNSIFDAVLTPAGLELFHEYPQLIKISPERTAQGRVAYSAIGDCAKRVWTLGTAGQELGDESYNALANKVGYNPFIKVANPTFYKTGDKYTKAECEAKGYFFDTSASQCKNSNANGAAAEAPQDGELRLDLAFPRCNPTKISGANGVTDYIAAWNGVRIAPSGVADGSVAQIAWVVAVNYADTQSIPGGSGSSDSSAPGCSDYSSAELDSKIRSAYDACIELEAQGEVWGGTGSESEEDSAVEGWLKPGTIGGYMNYMFAAHGMSVLGGVSNMIGGFGSASKSSQYLASTDSETRKSLVGKEKWSANIQVGASAGIGGFGTMIGGAGGFIYSAALLGRFNSELDHALSCRDKSVDLRQYFQKYESCVKDDTSSSNKKTTISKFLNVCASLDKDALSDIKNYLVGNMIASGLSAAGGITSIVGAVVVNSNANSANKRSQTQDFAPVADAHKAFLFEGGATLENAKNTADAAVSYIQGAYKAFSTSDSVGMAKISDALTKANTAKTAIERIVPKSNSTVTLDDAAI